MATIAAKAITATMSMAPAAAAVRAQAQAPGSDEARRWAEEILADARFHERTPPAPFQGVIDWVTSIALPPARWIAGAVAWIVESVPPWAGIPLVLVLVAWVAYRLAVQRSAAEHGRTPAGIVRERADPVRLEAGADEAQRRGDLAEALRLRFHAGLLRLSDAGVIAYSSSITTGDVRRATRSAEFARIARTFDHVVYGGRPPSTQDVELAREGWPRVLAEASRR